MYFFIVFIGMRIPCVEYVSRVLSVMLLLFINVYNKQIELCAVCMTLGLCYSLHYY